VKSVNQSIGRFSGEGPEKRPIDLGLIEKLKVNWSAFSLPSGGRGGSSAVEGKSRGLWAQMGGLINYKGEI
jgi:hypothetical protein